MTKPKKTKNIVGLTVVCLILAAIYLVLINKQNIYDEIALYNYKPPSEISSIASQDGMTAYTKKVFYVNHTQLISKSSFSNYCPNGTEQYVVLGCYHLNQKGIYLLSVNNTDLAGIEQVTAAYETLHAIYQRLSPSDQAKLNSQLISFENSGLTDPTIKNNIAIFRKTEPGQVLNEMTSLFGTEVQNLPPGLNSFYAKYFTNRQTLLAFYNNYQSAFTSRISQINSYDSQLSDLISTINANNSELNSQLSNIEATQNHLNSLRSANQITQYNQGVPAYNQLVNNYNDLVNTNQQLVNQYTQILAERNSIALSEQQLTQAITSPHKVISN